MNISKNSLKSDDKRVQLLRFIIVGGIASAIQYSCYWALIHFFSINAVIASVASYLISFVFNFIMSNIFTFHTTPNKLKAISFGVSHVINFILQTALVAVFALVVPAEWALLPAMAICVPINFLLVRFSLTSQLFADRR